MSDLIIDKQKPGICILRLNRPLKRNAISTPLLARLAEACEAGDKDETIRVFIVTGTERLFASGADIDEIRVKAAPEGLNDPRPELWRRLRATRKPVIAAVEGWCLGAGNELAMCADMIIAGKSAKFGQPETSLGLIPGAGGGAVLARLVGRARAMKMVLTGMPVSAEEAAAFGLVTEVVEDGGALDAACALALLIAARAPLAMQQAKAVIRQGLEMPLSAHLAMERQAFSLLLSSADKDIGIDAFINKHTPSWTGK